VVELSREVVTRQGATEFVLKAGETMITSYILIQTHVGRGSDVNREVVQIEGVISAEQVTGPYDVIVRAEAGTLDELGQLVVNRIQAVEGISRTLTCPISGL